MKRKLAILAFMLLVVSIVWGPFGAGIAYFSDTDASRGTITAGTWYPQEEYCLEVDTGGAWMTGSGKQIRWVQITNACCPDPSAGAISIVAITVTWELNSLDEHIEHVQILESEKVEWGGTAVSGEPLQLPTPASLDPCEDGRVNFNFDSDLRDREFTVEFLMGDGSTKAVTFTPAPPGNKN